MSGRPRFSLAGLSRALKISAVDLSIVVEGPTDRTFYSRLFNAATGGAGIRFVVRTAVEVTAAGGKPACIRLHDFLRARGKLRTANGTRHKVVAFVVDKDVDDYLRMSKRSPHFLYTEWYSLENHLFLSADLSLVGASASELAVDTVRDALGNQGSWLETAAQSWQQWTELCFLSRSTNANVEANYSVTSRINGAGGVDATLAAAFRSKVGAAAGLPAAKFAALEKKAKRTVDDTFDSGEHDLLFNGKWYLSLFATWLKALGAANPPYQSNVEGPISALLRATADIDAPPNRRLLDRARTVALLVTSP